MSKRLAATFRREARREPPPEVAALRLSLPDLLRLHGQGSAAVLLMLCALLSATPLAGAGTVLAFVILALAWRWHRGADADILPRRLGELRLSATWSRRCLHALAWLYAMSQRLLKARWTVLLHPRTHVAWGAWIALMGVLILLPLPLGNVLPGLSLVLLSLAWMFRDGLALLASAAVGAGAIGFALAMSHVILASVELALGWIKPLL